MTILSGHGRSTVRAASSSIAIVAANSGSLNGLRRGSTRRISCRVNSLPCASAPLPAPSTISAGPDRGFCRARAREDERAVVVADSEQLARRARRTRQTQQYAPSRYPAKQLWLVVDARIAILDVERIDHRRRCVIVEANADQASFGVAVPGAEREVPHAVEDRPAPIDLERLQHVRMMSDDDICAAIDRETPLGAVFGGRTAIVRDSPVERHDDAVGARAQGADVLLERLWRIHRASRQAARSGAAAVPVIAREAGGGP